MDNKTIKILIVEDDMIIATQLAAILKDGGYSVHGIIPSAEAALNQIAVNPPDIVLMDIQLDGAMDGIEAATNIHKSSSIPVIFLTANADQLTFDRSKIAFPIAFISKPYKPLDLLRTIDLVMNKVTNDNETKRSDPSDQILDDRVFVHEHGKKVKIIIKDILYIRAERNYCSICTAQKNYILSLPLKTFAERLDSDLFIRVHRSFLVNIKMVDAIDESYVFIGDTAIPVSKEKKEILSKRLRLI